ncbi:MAG: transglutaminase-like domain-containing protein, partial [Sphaerochaetaceae bacterium]
HIVFTPYLRALAAEIVGDETNPLVKARRIYDFITTNVMYSYVRRYDTIDDLSEYAAVNLKGDCGIQALLFITLCRICGIPARWQSGLYVTPEEIGCHDWAEFFIAPYGWLFCDCSFGGGAWRGGKTDRWNHYFGNLDVLRLPASGAIQTPFDPPKRHWRGDPIDNQRGEMEYEDAGLSHSQIDFLHRTISFEWMD